MELLQKAFSTLCKPVIKLTNVVFNKYNEPEIIITDITLRDFHDYEDSTPNMKVLKFQLVFDNRSTINYYYEHLRLIVDVDSNLEKYCLFESFPQERELKYVRVYPNKESRPTFASINIVVPANINNKNLILSIYDSKQHKTRKVKIKFPK